MALSNAQMVRLKRFFSLNTAKSVQTPWCLSSSQALPEYCRTDTLISLSCYSGKSLNQGRQCRHSLSGVQRSGLRRQDPQDDLPKTVASGGLPQNTQIQRIHGEVTDSYGENTEQPHFSCDLLSFPVGGVAAEAPDESFPAQGEDLYGWFESITGATENLCG